jgi:hypothetical protein
MFDWVSPFLYDEVAFQPPNGHLMLHHNRHTFTPAWLSSKQISKIMPIYEEDSRDREAWKHGQI